MKDIPGYEGLYAVTSCGKVWSHRRKKFLAQRLDKYGYSRITLSVDGKLKTYFVHQLVAQTYIPNPEGKTTVNHKDEVKTHNWISNLEWMTVKENINYGTRAERAAKTMKEKGISGGRPKKPVYCVELDKVFESARRAANELGLQQASICRCCNGKLKTAGKYHWNFVKEEQV